MAVKVYGTLRSGCTQRVLACFLEKEVEFEIVDIDLQAGEQKRPEFLLLQVTFIILSDQPDYKRFIISYI